MKRLTSTWSLTLKCFKTLQWSKEPSLIHQHFTEAFATVGRREKGVRQKTGLFLLDLLVLGDWCSMKGQLSGTWKWHSFLKCFSGKLRRHSNKCFKEGWNCLWCLVLGRSASASAISIIFLRRVLKFPAECKLHNRENLICLVYSWEQEWLMQSKGSMTIFWMNYEWINEWCYRVCIIITSLQSGNWGITGKNSLAIIPHCP